MGSNASKSLLEVERVNAFYGKSHILFDVSLKVKSGEVICLMGRNGAGKTTTLKSLMGWIIPKSGSIKFREIDIVGRRAYHIARLGIGFVPEDRRIFGDLTVGENIKLATRFSSKAKRRIRWSEERVFDLFPILKKFLNHRGGNLSGGEQQMLSIARTLLMNPDLLLLDEPAEGLAPIIVSEMSTQLSKVKKEGISMIVAEQQHLNFVLKLAEYAYIIDKGEIKFRGSMGDIKDNEEIKRKYLAV